MTGSKWGRPVLLALLLARWIVVLAIVPQMFLLTASERLARWERARMWFMSPVVAARTKLRQSEQAFSTVEDFVDTVRADLISGSDSIRNEDRQSRAEYYVMLFVILQVGASTCTYLLCHSDNKLMISLVLKFRERQLADRPAGSRYSKFAELCLYAAAWDDDNPLRASDVAEGYRDRYETDWEPRMGRLFANCWYAYEVVQETRRRLDAVSARSAQRKVTGD